MSNQSLPLVACALVLGLSGCVAAPMAQRAVSSASPRPTCLTGPGCQPTGGSLPHPDLAGGMAQTWHAMFALPAGEQKMQADPPPK
jgi:hypothetical protein